MLPSCDPIIVNAIVMMNILTALSAVLLWRRNEYLAMALLIERQHNRNEKKRKISSKNKEGPTNG